MPQQGSKPSKGRHTLNTTSGNPHGTGSRWSWIKFVLFFALGAAAGFSGGFLWFDEARYHFVFALTVASMLGVLGGRYGDGAIGTIMSILWWVD